MPLSDFWEVVDRQQLDGEQITNVYHAKRILAGANASNVAKAYIDSVVAPALKVLQINDLSRTVISVRNLGTPTDFTEFVSSGQPGTRLGQYMATWFAAGIRFPRTRTDMRAGYKRFAAGIETDNQDGVWVAGFLTELTTLATAIIAPWEEVAAPGVDVCDFVIIKRFCVVGGQSPCLKYRLPNTDAEIDAFHYNPTSAAVYAHATTQTSRKHLA